MTWIALTTAPNKTRKVRKRLRRLGMTAYVPALVSKRIVPKGGKVRRKRSLTVLMPYVLVEVPASEVRALWLHSVLSVKDVQGVVQIDGAAALIPQTNIDRLKDQVQRLVLEMAAKRHKAKLRKGGRAAIKSGSLAGRAGTVQWVSAKRVGLEARLFGAARVIAVERENVESAA